MNNHHRDSHVGGSRARMNIHNAFYREGLKPSPTNEKEGGNVGAWSVTRPFRQRISNNSRWVLRARAIVPLLSVVFSVILFVITTLPLEAQETVTYDDVIRVAERMYCPICENEPLDECRNQTCLQWKEEIRRRLEAGQSDEEIINYFVTQYGQHVVGIPQDGFLRLLSFAAPILGTLLAIAIGWMPFRRWQRNAPLKEQVSTSETPQPTDEDYRARLERDLAG